MTPEELAKIEERYAVWKKGAMAGIDPEGYERWSEARSQLYYFDVPALIAALKEARGRQAEAMAILREIAEGVPINYAVENDKYGRTEECWYCGADNHQHDDIRHADDCLWVRARKLVEGK